MRIGEWGTERKARCFAIFTAHSALPISHSTSFVTLSPGASVTTIKVCLRSAFRNFPHE